MILSTIFTDLTCTYLPYMCKQRQSRKGGSRKGESEDLVKYLWPPALRILCLLVLVAPPLPVCLILCSSPATKPQLQLAASASASLLAYWYVMKWLAHFFYYNYNHGYYTT